MKKKMIILVALLILFGILPMRIYAAENQEGIKKIKIPTVNENYYYTGKDIIAIPNHEGYTIQGKQGKDEGSYEVKLILKDNYIWDDGTSEAKSYSWNIIKKVKLNGTPSYTIINSSGKTLSDAQISKGSIEAEGKISWLLPLTTIVEMNKEYEWLFTPNDLDKYESISGKVILYPKNNEDKKEENKDSQKTDSVINGSVSNNTVSDNITTKPNETASGNTTKPNNTTSGNTTNKKPQTVSDNRTEQEKLLDNIKDKTTATLTNNRTKKKEDIRLEIRVTFPEEKITSDLKSKGINSAEQIAELLKNALKNSTTGITGDHTNLYDVSLIYTKDYGTTWKTGTKQHFPSDGYLKVSIPIPGQLDPNLYNFAVAHMFSSDDFGKVPGEIELPQVWERTDDYGIHYLDFYVTGLSPIMVGWEEEGAITVNEEQNLSEMSQTEEIEGNAEMEETVVEEQEQSIEKSDLIKLILIGAGLLILLILTLWIAKKIAWG